ncbi:MAG: DUF4142 domain-containing protein [Myxococcaceae bacterium]|nr:DUF4142 domain-containing protein [Myxococcaceae bacterium]
MRRYLLGAGLLGILGLGAACAHDDKSESARKTGQEVGEAVADKAYFADQLALLDQKQIALGEMALQKSTSSEIRVFAQQLVENHRQHLASVQNYAEAAAMSLAVMELSTQESMEGTGGAGRQEEGVRQGVEQRSAKHDEKLDKQIDEFTGVLNALSGKSGEAFDKAFLMQVRKDQEHGGELVEEGLKRYRDDASLAMLLSRSGPVFERQAERSRILGATRY